MQDMEIPLIEQRLEIIKLIPGGAKKILDIGCSAGDVGLSIKRRLGCEVVGIEIDPEKARHASSKLDKVLTGDAETLKPDLCQRYFDCIIFADVLEHLRRPDEALKKYGLYLKDDGRFIISIPNIRHITVLFDLVFMGEWRYRPFGIMDEGHMRFFTLKSFKRLMKEAGLQPLSMDRILSIKGSRYFNMATLGIFKDFLAAQYVFSAKKA